MRHWTLTAVIGWWLLASGCASSTPNTGTGGGAAVPCGPDERIAGDGCVPVGVPEGACGEGFQSDGLGGCRAILPPEPCGPGMLAVPGQTACAPIADCPRGRWGFVREGDAVVYVDAGYSGADADGSATKPFPTIGEATMVAASGDTVAVADGVYEEDVSIERAFTLTGRCPDAVTIRGLGIAPAAVLVITEPSRGAVVRGLSVTGPSAGVGVAATDAALEEVRIHDTGGHGIDVIAQLSPTSLALRTVLVEGATELGVLVAGATVTLGSTSVRATRANDGGFLGVGVFARAGDGSQALEVPSVVLGDGVLLEDHFGAALSLSGAELAFTRSLVRDIVPQAGDDQAGFGIFGLPDPGTELPSTMALDQVVVERTHVGGVVMLEGELTAARLTVTDVLPNPSTPTSGAGVVFQLGSTGGASGAVSDSLIVRARGAGVLVAASDATVEGTRIVDSLPYDSEASFGDGVLVAAFDEQASLVLGGSRIEGSERAGVASFGGSVVIGDTMLDCNSIDLNGQDLGGTFSFEDLGGNVCGCDGQDHTCQNQGATLLPPAAPP